MKRSPNSTLKQRGSQVETLYIHFRLKRVRSNLTTDDVINLQLPVNPFHPHSLGTQGVKCVLKLTLSTHSLGTQGVKKNSFLKLTLSTHTVWGHKGLKC